MKILLAHPGASWSTADVFDGLLYGLKQHGVTPSVYRLDERIALANKWLYARYRQQKRTRQDLPRPTQADVVYQASVGILEMALRQQVDVVVIVSGMFFHPDAIMMLKRAHQRVCVLFTESPYDLDAGERRLAAVVAGGWTNERSSVESFRAVNPRVGYLPHAWHPERHRPGPQPGDEQVPSHDVVFVGSGFPERVQWFNAIDWSGIDLGLYGTWPKTLSKALRGSVRGGLVTNEGAAALYRRAKVGLNLYRQYASSTTGPRFVHGESLSPRAYELARCGVFHVSDYRSEVVERFGDLVPTFKTPFEASAVIRSWLADDAGRARVAAQLPALVAEASWTERAATVLGDLSSLCRPAEPGGPQHGTLSRTERGDLSRDERIGHRDVGHRPH